MTHFGRIAALAVLLAPLAGVHASDAAASPRCEVWQREISFARSVADHDAVAFAGHLHPHVSLGGRGRQHVRLPAFVFGPRVGVLPAFSSFTGSGMYERCDADTTFVVAGDDVLPAPHRR